MEGFVIPLADATNSSSSCGGADMGGDAIECIFYNQYLLLTAVESNLVELSLFGCVNWTLVTALHPHDWRSWNF